MSSGHISERWRGMLEPLVAVTAQITLPNRGHHLWRVRSVPDDHVTARKLRPR
jgi:hypothetical protein